MQRPPGRRGIWIIALALVAACVIGCCGVIVGAAITHGFDRGDHSRSRPWGDERGPGRDGGRDDGRFGPGGDRVPFGGGNGPRERRPGRPTPVPPTPATPATPAPPPSATPTA